MSTAIENTFRAKEAFTKQAEIFDDLYANDVIVNYKRQRVREHLEAELKPAAEILELNAGTGEDAIYLAKKGHKVHCTDISEKMLSMIEKKVMNEKLNHLISVQSCSFLELDKLDSQKKYDHVFSNFGGLNSTDQLSKVLSSLHGLLKVNGAVTLVIMPRFCLWENLLVLKGNFKTAFRRYQRNGAESNIEGVHFKSWYYHPQYVIRHLQENFELCRHEGLCTLVPPSYLKNFPYKFPKLYGYLIKAEKKLNSKWPWKNCGDYYIITLRKRN